jgi:hypothetical protein
VEIRLFSSQYVNRFIVGAIFEKCKRCPTKYLR